MSEINPALLAKGQPLAGSALDEHRFLTHMPVAQVVQLFLNPLVAENAKQLPMQPLEVQEAAADREVIQRLAKATKAKRDNVTSYAAYILRTIKGELNGSMPAIDAWVENQLPCETGYAYLPFRTKLIALDGDTQLMALFKNYEATPFPELAEYQVPVVIHHNRDRDWARQQLADRNLLGVKMTQGMALQRDTRDPVTQIARQVANKVGLVLGHGRQVAKNSDENVTLSAWRQAIAATIVGRGAAQLGTKTLELPLNADTHQLEDDVTAAWTIIIDSIRPTLEGEARTTAVTSSPTVLFALGVLANHTLSDSLLRSEPHWSLFELRAAIADVNWSRRVIVSNEDFYPWEGITGKPNREKGTFSVGGVKEYGYAAAEALENPTSGRGKQVRTRAQ
ncbi:DNA sulfur modification protein DndB (plasmid) [Kineococcus sp. DHX-1]|uniref:DNA sulfur modification protein DndB n=1 Tax=Kineococcus sp. DHX-1 TaxID=3349638 RepID=UPI0036D2C86A